jgi:hypothetical protein
LDGDPHISYYDVSNGHLKYIQHMPYSVFLPLVSLELGACETRLLIADDFSDPASGWSNKETATTRYAYENGVYVIEDKEAPFGAGASPDRMVPNDMTIKVDGWADAVDAGFFGVVFGLGYRGDYDWEKGYTFVIRPSDQYYSLQKWNFEADSRTTLGSGYSMAIIQDGTAHQTVEVRRVGNGMTLVVNDTVVTTVSDTDNPLIRTGSVGLITFAPKANFDDFEVYVSDCSVGASDVRLAGGKNSVFEIAGE